MWTKAQVDAYVVQHGATYVTTKGGIQWWRMPNRSWLAVRPVGAHFEVRQLPPGSCGCGG